ncbi:MAG: DUF2207 domain-containing protein [Spirochaetales bacterium]|nr:DUF2207 domain-containing protein [Spirochaetales bacterium]
MKRRSFLAFLLLLALVSLTAGDYTFRQIDLSVKVGPDNSYDVTERIVAEFFVPKHGIFREIPIRYGNQRIGLKNLQASDPIIKDDVSSGWATFRLGDANVTIKGLKEYVISYTLEIGDDRNRYGDFFYYNIIGPGWQEEIGLLTFTVEFPHPIDPQKVSLTGGRSGSTLQRGEYMISSDRMTITGSAQKMKPGEALTLYIDLEEGYFSEVKKFIDLTIPLYIGAIILFLLLGFHSFALWKRYGRDEPFVPVVRFEPPTDLSPLEVGYLFDGTVDMKDLSSMLFYWADLGYIQIEELGKKDYRIIKLKDLVSDKEHERRLFNAFFKRGDGTSVDLKNLSKSTTFAKDIEKTKSLTRSYFTGERELKDQKAERKRTVPFLYGVLLVVFHAWGTTYSYPGGVIFTLPLTFGIGLLVLTAVAIPKIFDSWMFARKGKALLKSGAFLLVYLASFGIIYIMYREEVLLSSALSLLFSASALGIPIIFATFGAITAKRSSYGQKILEEIVGYREFIEKVEIDKLKVMIKDDPELFYHVLGYAVVLGLENTWAKKFDSIAMTQASWYIGSGGIHPFFYASMANNLTTGAISKALYTQASSGSGRGPISPSFGGGGFSGGGFSGGGGGAW